MKTAMCNLPLKLCDSTPPRCGLITGCKKSISLRSVFFFAFFFFAHTLTKIHLPQPIIPLELTTYLPVLTEGLINYVCTWHTGLTAFDYYSGTLTKLLQLKQEVPVPPKMAKRLNFNYWCDVNSNVSLTMQCVKSKHVKQSARPVPALIVRWCYTAWTFSLHTRPLAEYRHQLAESTQIWQQPNVLACNQITHKIHIN